MAQDFEVLRKVDFYIVLLYSPAMSEHTKEGMPAGDAGIEAGPLPSKGVSGIDETLQIPVDTSPGVMPTHDFSQPGRNEGQERSSFEREKHNFEDVGFSDTLDSHTNTNEKNPVQNIMQDPNSGYKEYCTSLDHIEKFVSDIVNRAAGPAIALGVVAKVTIEAIIFGFPLTPEAVYHLLNQIVAPAIGGLVAVGFLVWGNVIPNLFRFFKGPIMVQLSIDAHKLAKNIKRQWDDSRAHSRELKNLRAGARF
ncbi:hypothetical protein COU15_01830 [Candidatus Kaiserbacteria bacterium CG10_big_fil_rev_8_21_14_0_10_45_20]|uniref:Uncharacterized protein n=1 Tax=Candidatus Kaiserbacteria bacterium CG10_big_fil_rev_8_21_14_0_10_45_20 TaxID=1974607 RepID=A0A2H0UFE9_9BACT|nr:MAG: hypothetical protein COU15_01830 [Candidatus Kaiserbacteria bacterium CG10_big_fil_rev_8_21_14_0_10_45_20]